MPAFFFALAEFILLLLQGITAFYLLLPTLCFVVHLLSGKKFGWFLKNTKPVLQKSFDFAAIVTAHKDLRFIPPLVDSCLKQTYSNFVIYVVADGCTPSDLNFQDPRIVVIYPEIPLNAKVKSIHLAVDRFVREHDVMVIFDADNLLHPTYFERLNQYYQRGFEAVQTHMLSKNTDSIYAKLDSIGHIYNTFLERQFKMEIHCSSSILGLGISLKVSLYKDVMYTDGLGGFDKKLQAYLVSNIAQIAFAEDVFVYDEKVEDGNTLEKQRTRWIFTYFKYASLNAKVLVQGFKKFNFSQIVFGLTSLRPPLFLLMLAAILFLLFGFILPSIDSITWALVLFLFIFTFISIVLTHSLQKGMAKAFVFLPIVVFRQVLALLKIKAAKRDYLKTEHKQVLFIEEVLKNESI